MAGRSSRVRRYKSKYDERRLKEKTQLKNEVALQRSYISDYEKFSKIADTTSTWASSGTYRNPREIEGLDISVFRPQAPRSRKTVNRVIGKDDYGKDIYQFNSFVSFKYFTPEQRISFAGGSTSKPKADRIDKYSSYSSNRRALPSTFQKIADRLKPLALGAEMGALSKAEKAWASWEDIAFDSSSVGSSRTSARNAAAKATQSFKQRAAAEAGTAAAVAASQSQSNLLSPLSNIQQIGSGDPNLRAPQNKGAATSHPNAIGGTYALAGKPSGFVNYGIDNFFGAQRDSSGQLKKHDASQYLSPRKATGEEKKVLDNHFNYINSGLAAMIPSQLKKQQQEEDDLERQLKKVDKALVIHEAYEESGGIQIYNQNSTVDMLSAEKQDIIIKLQNINNDQKVVAAALGSSDFNAMTDYLKKSDVDVDNVTKYMAVNTTQSQNSKEQEQAYNAYELELVSLEADMIASDKAHLAKLNKNNFDGRKQGEIDDFILGLDGKYDKLITMVDTNQSTTHKGVNAGDTASVLGIMQQLDDKYLKPTFKEKKQIDNRMQTLGLDISQGYTNEERVEKANRLNKTAEDKKEFEKLTGIDAGDNAGISMNEWFYNINTYGPDDTLVGFSSNDINEDWYSAWLNNETMFTRDDDLKFYGEIDKKKKEDLAKSAGLIKKYDSWERANELIGAQLSEFKQDVGAYYRVFASAPNVSKQDIAKAWHGTDTIEGESYTGYANYAIGGVRGGDYWVGDAGRLIEKTKEFELDLTKQIESREKKLTDLKLEQGTLRSLHDSHRSGISEAVEAGTKHGNISIDQKLTNKLEASSQKLFDINRDVAALEYEQDFLEKSLNKTSKEREIIEKQRKIQEYNLIHGQSQNITDYRPRSPSRRPSLKSFSRRNDGGGGQQKTRGGQSTLGGLVV